MKIKKAIILTALILLAVPIFSGCGKGDEFTNSAIGTESEIESSTNSEAETNSNSNTKSDTSQTLSSSSSESRSDKTILYVTGTETADVFGTSDENGSKLSELKYGTKVELIDDNASAEFSHIASVADGTDGYIRTEYLTDTASAVTSGESVYVSAAGKYLYREYGGSDIIRNLDLNEALTLLAKTPSGYWRVKTMYNEIGYVTVDTISTPESNSTTVSSSPAATGNTSQSSPSDSSAVIINSDNSSVSTSTSNSNSNSISNNSTSSFTTPDENTPAPHTAADTASVLNNLIENAQSTAGGSWQAALIIPSDGTTEYTSDSPKQAASLIKLFIMGAIYEKYDTYITQEPELDTYLHQMITISDNSAANHLVGILGSGNTDAGKNIVTAYCSTHGYYNTSMGRLLLESTDNGDNYTSAYDCARFLLAAYNGELPHSADMISLLKQQERISKIPAGVPVQTANKTGELTFVQNDAAIVYADNPYILCVLAEDVDAGSGVSGIVNISSEIYKTIENN